MTAWAWRSRQEDSERVRRNAVSHFHESQRHRWERRQREIRNLDAIIARPMPERPDRVARRLGLTDEVAW